jgi:hypothetical protein
MNYFEEGVKSGYDAGEKGSRVGYEIGFKPGPGRVKVDPSVLAAYKLNKILEKYPEITKDARNQIQSEFEGFTDLPVLNLEAFASVLTFLRDYPNPTPNEFKDEIIAQYFVRLLPVKEISSEERKRLIIRLKAQFLKYIVAIKNYRESFDISNISKEEFEPNEEQYEEESE